MNSRIIPNPGPNASQINKPPKKNIKAGLRTTPKSICNMAEENKTTVG